MIATSSGTSAMNASQPMAAFGNESAKRTPEMLARTQFIPREDAGSLVTPAEGLPTVDGRTVEWFSSFGAMVAVEPEIPRLRAG
ncbi:MAG: hypothetical protein DMF56_26100 [Acidobacteria bacterium]|nr:MAG: hypothetical protein DMF56_26100 [Acidobacteriota bacterium]